VVAHWAQVAAEDQQHWVDLLERVIEILDVLFGISKLNPHQLVELEQSVVRMLPLEGEDRRNHL